MGTHAGSGRRPITGQIENPNGVNIATLTGALTLTDRSSTFQRLDPGGSTRIVTMPIARDGILWCFYNAGSLGENLTINDSAGATVATVQAGETALIGVDGTTYGVLLQTSIDVGAFLATSVDLQGNADALILDDDGDTTISSPTDDQIDFEIAGADDFRMLANIFRALSGSVIETNTIDETTAATGVTVDGLLIQDGSVRPDVIADPGDGGAIPVDESGSCAMTSAGAETRTMAIPTFEGQRITLFCDTYVGDIVVTTSAACNVANNNTLTFGAVSEALELVGVTVGGALVWQIGWNDGVGLTTV